MPKQRLDLIGQTYHRLTVLEEAPSKGQSRYWRCRCACGNETIVQQGSLRSGKVKSCGWKVFALLAGLCTLTSA